MRILFFAALAALSGCASQPATERAPVALAAPAESVAATDAEFTPPSGYKRQFANGNTIYCAKIVVLGSRFPKEDCRSQSELEQMEVMKKEMRNRLDRAQSACASAVACGYK